MMKIPSIPEIIRRNQFAVVSLLSILFVGFYSRYSALDIPINYFELYTMERAFDDLSMDEAVARGDISFLKQALYYSIAAGISSTFGWTIENVRWFSLLCSLGSIIVGFLFARKVFGVQIALVFAALIASLPAYTAMGTLARCYSFHTFLTLSSIYIATSIVTGNSDKKTWPLFFAFSLIASVNCYLHFSGMAATVGIIGVMAIVGYQKKNSKLLAGIGGSAAAICLAFIPYWKYFRMASEQVQNHAEGFRFEGYINFFTVGYPVGLYISGFCTIVVFLEMVLPRKYAPLNLNSSQRFCLSIAVLWCVGTGIIIHNLNDVFYRTFDPRYFAVFGLGALLLMAAMPARLLMRSRVVTAILIAVPLTFYLVNPFFKWSPSMNDVMARYIMKQDSSIKVVATTRSGILYPLKALGFKSEILSARYDRQELVALAGEPIWLITDRISGKKLHEIFQATGKKFSIYNVVRLENASELTQFLNAGH